MFFVVVVLQSLLIAQMSDTFTNVQIDAKRALILNRARTILNIEETTNVKNLSWISKVILFIIVCMHRSMHNIVLWSMQLLKFAKIKLSVLTEEIWENPESKYMYYTSNDWKSWLELCVN